MKKMIQHIIATLLMVWVIWGLCWMAADVQAHETIGQMYMRGVLGLVNLYVIYRVGKALQGWGLLPEVEKVKDGWND